MKNIKQFILMLVMIVCMGSLAACAGPGEVTDPTVKQMLTEASTQNLEAITGMDDEQISQIIAQAASNGSDILEAGLTSYQNSKNEIGSFVSLDSLAVYDSDDGYKVEIDYTGSNRKATCTMGYDSSMQNFTLLSFNPVYTMAEKMEKAGMNLLMGMGTVFCVLIFISFLISLFKFIPKLEAMFRNKGKDKQKATQPAASAEPTAAIQATDDMELIAVITAAIAASTGASQDSLVVRSIKRVNKSNWKKG